MRIGLVQCPGSHGLREAERAFRLVLQAEVAIIWHGEETISNIDLLVLPGGASFGNVLRPGALARTSPIAPAIRRYARTGRTLGIGNGFQILCELGVLPGVLLANRGMIFRTGWVSCRGERDYRLPIACAFGHYHNEAQALREMESNGQILLRYVEEEVETGIAAIGNSAGNVIGMMVRPERAIDLVCGGDDGRELIEWVAGKLRAG